MEKGGKLGHMILFAIVLASLVGFVCVAGASATDTSEYYPLQVGDVRLWLDQDTVQGQTEEVREKETIFKTEKISSTDAALTGVLDMGTWHIDGDLMAWTDEGLKWFRVYDCEDEVINTENFDPPILLVPREMQVGTKYEFSTSGITGYSELESIGETVSVKAGTFNNCIKVHLYLQVGGESADQTLWLAPGVGQIRFQSVSEDETESGELIAGVIGGKLVGSPLDDTDPFSLLGLATYSASGCGLVINNLVVDNEGQLELWNAKFTFNLNTLSWEFVGAEQGHGIAPDCQCSMEGLDFGNATIDSIIDNVSGMPEMIMALPYGGNGTIYGLGFLFSPETLSWSLLFVD